MAALTEATDLFLLDAQLEGRAACTREKHGQELRRYGRWLDAEGLDWRWATESDMRRYARTRAHLGESARGATFCTLRVFYRWAIERGEASASPAACLKTPKRPRPQPKALKQAHVRHLIAHLAGQEGLRARRDEALILTALYTGLRAGELARLRWGDIDLDAALITIWLSKMHHGRVVPIHPLLLSMLTAWQQLQALGGDAPTFATTHADSTQGQPITSARVGKIATRVARETGLPLTAHVLRHTFATWTLRRSKDLYAVSKALGHAALKQTEIYVSADVEQIARAVGALPGPNEW